MLIKDVDCAVCYQEVDDVEIEGLVLEKLIDLPMAATEFKEDSIQTERLKDYVFQKDAYHEV